MSIQGSSSPIMVDETCVRQSGEGPVIVTISSNTTATPTTNGNSDANDRESEDTFEKRKRKKTSDVWNDFTEVEKSGVPKMKCNHCGCLLSKMKSGTTSSMKRHMDNCPSRLLALKKQKLLNFPPATTNCVDISCISALTNGKYDHSKMRKAAANWVLMHEHPFSIVEEDGFNILMKCGNPQYEKISRNQVKNDCVSIFELEKKKLKSILSKVNRISLTTDLWKSKGQKIEYMVITTHFIDSDWKLHKRVLNFVHISPPRNGVNIAATLFKCVKEWGIESKVYSVSVDNASANDAAIRNLVDTFSKIKKLPYGGKLFHVRCCAHILNLMVQDGISKINTIIENVRDSVSFINANEARLQAFANIVQLKGLPSRKLILDCRTRWNSTYEMLACAVQLMEAFPEYAATDPLYDCCPTVEEWYKVQKVCEILEPFSKTTNIISGSDYPTSNLFLSEVYRVKMVLDKNENDGNQFIKDMVQRMKLKFDKYWGECNLLMAIASVLDPRCKMRLVQFCFPRIYPYEASEQIDKVKKALEDLYSEYAEMHHDNSGDQGVGTSSTTTERNNNCVVDERSTSWSEFESYMRTVETIQPEKSDLEVYLEESCVPYKGEPSAFSALDWWKVNQLKFRTLSMMASDVLAIPISTVASEATFSAGSRVIDSYRASLGTNTVEALLCGGDWVRNLFGVKKKNKVNIAP